MTRLLGLLAAAGFIAAVVVHGRTFIPATTTDSAVWLLHLGIFVVFALTVFAMRNMLGPRPSLRDMFSILPSWAPPLLIAAAAYAGFNFFHALSLLQGGTPEIRDGQYVLLSHGKLIQTLTADEYNAMLRYQVRLFSGHWIFLYLIPAIFLLFNRGPVGRSPDRRAANG